MKKMSASLKKQMTARQEHEQRLSAKEKRLEDNNNNPSRTFKHRAICNYEKGERT